jgi:TetR/AcrR family transcriptional repressor of uid operon
VSGPGEKITARDAQRLATRERLFMAAVAEFKQSGMDQADVGAIVEAAAVAHGTFFFHFPTKEHVLAEMGQREEVRMAAELDRFLAVPRDLSTTLLELVRMTARMERRVGTVLFKDLLALYFSPARPELDLWANHPVITRVIEEFERAGDAGVFESDVDPTNSAMFFLMGLYGLLITHDRNAARNNVLEQLVTTVLRGLGIR